MGLTIGPPSGRRDAMMTTPIAMMIKKEGDHSTTALTLLMLL
jgi:hypothetical protein